MNYAQYYIFQKLLFTRQMHVIIDIFKLTL